MRNTICSIVKLTMVTEFNRNYGLIGYVIDDEGKGGPSGYLRRACEEVKKFLGLVIIVTGLVEVTISLNTVGERPAVA